MNDDELTMLEALELRKAWERAMALVAQTMEDRTSETLSEG